MDLTTGAPQKLWRLVGEALRSHEYNLILWERAPSVDRMPIGDTGTTWGSMAVEHPPEAVEEGGGFHALRLALGLLLAIGGAVWLAAQGVETWGGWITVILGLVLALASIETAGTRYRSRVIGVELRGEVYASEAEVSDQTPRQQATTARRSLVSDVELVVRAACLESEPAGGNQRELRASLGWDDCPLLKTDFDTITGAIRQNIQPVVEVDEVQRAGRRGDPRG